MTPIFEYKCKEGHRTHSTFRGDWVTCETRYCYNIAHRVFSFSISRSFPEHFNDAVHTYVNTETQMKDELKRQAERNSIESGFESDYEYLSPSDMADRKSLGVTEEGLRPEVQDLLK